MTKLHGRLPTPNDEPRGRCGFQPHSKRQDAASTHRVFPCLPA